MPSQTIVWNSATKLECSQCLPAEVILCINPEKQVNGFSTIEGELLEAKLAKNHCGGSLYTYTISYQSNQIVPGENLDDADLYGIVCKGCLTEWVTEQIFLNGGGTVFTNIAAEGDGTFANPINVRVSPHPSNDITVDSLNALFLKLRVPHPDNILTHVTFPTTQSGLSLRLSTDPGNATTLGTDGGLYSSAASGGVNFTLSSALVAPTPVTNGADIAFTEGDGVSVVLNLAGLPNFLYAISARLSTDGNNIITIGMDGGLHAQPVSTDGGNLITNGSDGRAYLDCEEILPCINVDPLTIDGDGSPEYPFTAIGATPDCTTVRACINVDPYTIDGDGSPGDPFSALYQAPDCTDVLGCINVDPMTIGGDGTPGDPFTAIGATPDCTTVRACINVDPYTIDGDGSPEYPFSAIQPGCDILREADFCFDPRYGTYYFNDLFSVPGPDSAGVQGHAYGAGASIVTASPFDNAIGEIIYNTGTTTTGISGVSGEASTLVSTTYVNSRLVNKIRLNSISGTGNTFTIIVGFCLGITVGFPVLGTYFIYDQAGEVYTGSPNWRTIVYDGVSGGNILTSVPVITGDPILLEIQQDVASQTRFYIDGVLVATHNTDLPGILPCPAVWIQKYTGTATRSLIHDFIHLVSERITPL